MNYLKQGSFDTAWKRINAVACRDYHIARAGKTEADNAIARYNMLT